MHGLLTVESPGGSETRGPGQVVGRWERLDGGEEVRVVAETDVRLVAVDRADWEAAQSG